MEIPHHLLNRQISCECGRNHLVPIEKIVVDGNMVSQLQSYLRNSGYQNVLVVADSNTYEVLGETVHRHLLRHGINSQTLIFSNTHDLLPDEVSIATVRQRIQQDGPEIALAVGSGVINDIVRYATYQEGLSYVVIGTAPSMDGYASSIAALQFSGVKTTLPAQAPSAIFADPTILSTAPWALIQSGFGDLVGKVISLLDWKLSHILYEEYFCQKAYDIVVEPLRYCIRNASKLRNREQESMRNLFIGLINSGIAMAMMGNSRPCSGSEHHCSHYWDLLAYKQLRGHASHGIQVGYATHWMMRFYRTLSELDEVQVPSLPQLTDAWEHHVMQFYGPGATEIRSAQQAKARWLQERPQAVATRQATSLVEALQSELSLFSETEQSLSVIGIPCTPDFLGISNGVLEQTFLHAKELRARYTIFDFLEGQGLLESAVHRVLS